MQVRQRFGVALFAALAFAGGSLALAADSSAPQTTVARAIPGVTGDQDPFLWLEDKDGARALAWVKEQNARTVAVLERDPRYPALYAAALKLYESPDRIASPELLRGEIYNFWQDAAHLRGIWRRTTLESYRTDSPDWTTVLDLDKLAAAEHANWVWKGFTCEEPSERYCMISLSNGGEDAVTMREFDLDAGAFVPNGFVLPRGKQVAAWDGDDALLVSREWEPGELTASGYPYVVKRLQRGQALSSAVEVFSGEKTDQLFTTPIALTDGAGNHAALVNRAPTFFTTQLYIRTPHGLQRLALPPKTFVEGMVDGRLLFSLRQAWSDGSTSFATGSLIAVPLADALKDPAHVTPSPVYAPGPREAIAVTGGGDGVDVTKSSVILSIYHDVNGREMVFTPASDGTWAKRQIDLPGDSTTAVQATSILSDDAFLTSTSFLQPTALYLADTVTGRASVVKQLPPKFDASKDVVEQHEVASQDGTMIPYYVVHSKNMPFDGRNPTVLYAYGGFQIAVTPAYSGETGKLWLEHGGVYAIANIRGGGEFGPAWHEAGLTVHRQRIYDDFYAVAKDLVDRKITDPRHFGINGGSNGGLLMGVEFTQHPEMYNAVSIGIPLLDMMRFEHIEAGASWVDEYGSVSVPAQRAFLRSISPYQNLRPGVAYPEPFIWSTTKDDRVGPEAARKFAAKLAAMHVNYLYYEVLEGGHGLGANFKEDAESDALRWTYFTMKLM
ncbi:MAG TPA: prolyl oligopeptidase family serine peptidase [Candidatus Acidoferrales bacterium]|nr:prolyl oligopeptidase family serine peptidase [Candidatus Acidoferrales bacterium]